MAKNQQSPKAITILLIPFIIQTGVLGALRPHLSSGLSLLSSGGPGEEWWVRSSPAWGPLVLEAPSPLSLGPPATGLVRAALHKCWWSRHFSLLLLCLQLLSYTKKIPLLCVNCSISTIFQVEGSHQAGSSRKANLLAGCQASQLRGDTCLCSPTQRPLRRVQR